MRENMIRVVVVDDHRRTHEAVQLVLQGLDDIELVAHGSNGKEAIQLCAEHSPDVLLIDVMMPLLNGIEATAQIHQKFPQIKILVLSSFQDDESVYAMLRNGAIGYVLKGALNADLVSTIRATYAGKSVFSSEVTEIILKPKAVPSQQTFGLTERELEVLRLMAQGKNNQDIAAALVISQSTVKFHISNIEGKMGVDNRAEVIVLATKNNLI